MTLQLIYVMTTGLDEEIYYLYKNDKPYFSMGFPYPTKLTIDRKKKIVYVNNLFINTEYEKLIARLMLNLILEMKEALEIEGYTILEDLILEMKEMLETEGCTMLEDCFMELHGSDTE